MWIEVSANIDTHGVSNIDAYAISFESTESNEAIQTFVFANKDNTGHKYSVVQMSEDDEGVYSCKLLQTYANVSAPTPKNIDTSTSVYIVTIATDGSSALNGTMKTTTLVSN